MVQLWLPFSYEYKYQRDELSSLISEWVSEWGREGGRECCLAPTQQFSTKSYREHVSQWHDDEVCFVLDQHA
jgi:hypothetical protein